MRKKSETGFSAGDWDWDKIMGQKLQNLEFSFPEASVTKPEEMAVEFCSSLCWLLVLVPTQHGFDGSWYPRLATTYCKCFIKSWARFVLLRCTQRIPPNSSLLIRYCWGWSSNLGKWACWDSQALPDYKNAPLQWSHFEGGACRNWMQHESMRVRWCRCVGEETSREHRRFERF